MPPTTQTKSSKRRILVVDDKSDNTRLVRQCLEQAGGYEVREINDATAALAAAVAFKPDLILLDIRMPGLDGGDLAARLQADRQLAAVPIVFLTALVTKEEIKAGAARMGRYPVLAKPIVLPELLACIRQQLGG